LSTRNPVMRGPEALGAVLEGVVLLVKKEGAKQVPRLVESGNDFTSAADVRREPKPRIML